MDERVMIRGAGGATFEVDLPAEGSMRREQFDAQLARGEITIVESEPKPARKTQQKPASEPAPAAPTTDPAPAE